MSTIVVACLGRNPDDGDESGSDLVDELMIGFEDGVPLTNLQLIFSFTNPMPLPMFPYTIDLVAGLLIIFRSLNYSDIPTILDISRHY